MNFEYTSENASKIIQKLKDVGANLNCPRCGHGEFILNDGFTILPLQNNLSGVQLGGRGTPVVAVICKNCGLINHHALGVLKLVDLSNESKATEDSDKKQE
jgi:transcription elongation factor Elf1